MAKQEQSVHKKRGRPAGRRYGETIPMRLSPALKDEVDAWADKQPDAPSRSEALRRLVEMALKLKRTRRAEG
jgi:metal-responsive CopG/Arc/MetJ family transcriptional regulator